MGLELSFSPGHGRTVSVVEELRPVSLSIRRVPKDPKEAVKYWKTVLNIVGILTGQALGREIHQAHGAKTVLKW